MFKVNSIPPSDVHSTLAKHMLVDGFPLVVDLEKSKGSWLRCAKSGKEYLDFFSYFASSALGHNHSVMYREDVEKKLLDASRTKVSNSDKYTCLMAEFVDTLSRTAGVPKLPNYFFIDGGSNAVENAIKTAFDYKARKNGWGADEHNKINQLKIIHFEHAFHGRSGYSISLTNTDPNKTNYFPKFNWPRIPSPYIRFPISADNLEATINLENIAIQQIEHHCKTEGKYIAGIIIEPVICEGGNLHFRPEFFAELRRIANAYGIMLIFDEVQTAMMTGKWWHWQHHGTQPDIICFAKKFQIGGIMVSDKIDDIKDNVFKKPSRINSTFGGNLTDMVRCTAILETIVNENLLDNATIRGTQLIAGLEKLQNEMPEIVSNARGKGLLCAIDLPDMEMRNKVVQKCFDNGMIILSCGTQSLRFLPALTISEECINEGLKRLKVALA